MRISKGVPFGLALVLSALAVTVSPPIRADGVQEIAVKDGAIRAVAVAPGGAGVAAVVWGSSQGGDQVHWWHWQGRSGRWDAPFAAQVNTLAFHPGGALLVGDARDSRIAYMRWWKLAPGGDVIADCLGYPLGQSTKRGLGAIRGVHSFAVLADGKVVTGGEDATLAIWEGCEPTWLNREQCCYAEYAITVTADRDGVITSGEAGTWRGDALGYDTLGRRRWSPSPWTPALVERRPAAPPGLQADGEGCSVAADPNGQVAVSGTWSWTVSIDKRIWTLREGEKS